MLIFIGCCEVGDSPWTKYSVYYIGACGPCVNPCVLAKCMRLVVCITFKRRVIRDACISKNCNKRVASLINNNSLVPNGVIYQLLQVAGAHIMYTSTLRLGRGQMNVTLSGFPVAIHYKSLADLDPSPIGL